MSIYLICIAMLGLLCLALGFNVAIIRAKSGTLYGGESNPESKLYKAQRAHGNTIEYAPILAIIIFALGQSSQLQWVLWSMVAVTFFRYLLVLGILLPATMDKINPLRLVGSLGSFLSGFALVIALFIQAIYA
ncbi:MAG: MAPEG family protein [Porticoccaceae bacterium]|nr:MAPEG family protein [Porticoccaceae bacterium]